MTDLYAAPEAAQRVVKPALDYWALGMMLVEMLNGRHPFGDLPEGAIWKILSSIDPIDLKVLRSMTIGRCCAAACLPEVTNIVGVTIRLVAGSVVIEGFLFMPIGQP